ncbi:MAG: N-acetylmuramoyl-L-alanine amidase [Clostridia bacterium]|nr:N-acetylmuramoyl-L-alanine amidase [Clostridia bacterium]
MVETKPEAAVIKQKSPKPLYATVVVTLLTVVLIAIGAALLIPDDSIRIPDWVDEQIIEINGAGRRGVPIEAVNNIAVHYVGNPGTSAQANRNYFNQPTTQVSSHFIVGLDGEIIQCVPLNEKSSATNERNRDTISVEVCHPDKTGQFNEQTYASLVRLCAWLCDTYELEATDLIRHYDVTGKLCPLYYVEHPEAWEQLIQDVANYEE